MSGFVTALHQVGDHWGRWPLTSSLSIDLVPMNNLNALNGSVSLVSSDAAWRYREANVPSSPSSDNSDSVTEPRSDTSRSPDESDAFSSAGSYCSDIHYDSLDDDPHTPYPPPTYIDFESRDLRPPFPPTRPSAVSFDCKWLGGPHDGYPLATTLKEYFQLRRRNGSALGTLEFAALAQSQATFGLLEAVLRIKIPESFLLLQAEDGTTKLLTANLIILCRDLCHRMRVRHHVDQCRSWMEAVYVTLSAADRGLKTYLSKPRTNPFLAAGLSQETSEHILRVMCVIGYSLDSILSSSEPECERNPPIRLDFNRLVDSTKSAGNQLRAQGWCPWTTVILLEEFTFVGLEYARHFPPFLRHAGEHDGCTDMSCTANNVDLDTYVPRHSWDNCDCTPTIPPFHLVESLLSDKRIPIITLSDKGPAVQANDDVPYVAISHLWIDGLGSTTEQGLPTCQVSRISSLASWLVPSGAFWIDGLCIPGRKDLRKRAIQLMAKTYSEAAAVLVIDPGIRSCSKDAPLEEILLRIYTSGWMQRLWTFQEAILAKRLYFEFSDGLAALEDIMPSSEEGDADPLLSELCTQFYNILAFGSGLSLEEPSLNIQILSDGLRWRTASRLEDEALMIAGLLQLDAEVLLNASSPDDRMRSLLLQIQALSPDMIFTTAPKISGIPGFTWAPRSFMRGLHRGAWRAEESAICTPTGLLAEYASLILSEPVPELEENTRRVIRDTTRPGCNFLMQRSDVVPHNRRESCNAILLERDIPTVVGSYCFGVGVSMVGTEQGMFGEEVHVCHYSDIGIEVEVINASEASRLQASGLPVIDAKLQPGMKVKVV